MGPQNDEVDSTSNVHVIGPRDSIRRPRPRLQSTAQAIWVTLRYRERSRFNTPYLRSDAHSNCRPDDNTLGFTGSRGTHQARR